MDQSVISIIDNRAQRSVSKRLRDSLLSHWPEEQSPKFTFYDHFSADATLAFAESDSQLLEILPLLLELQSIGIPTILACNETGKLTDLVNDLDLVQIKHSSDHAVICGILFGLLQRNEQVSLLRGQVGFVKRMHGSLQEHLVQLQEELETAASVQKECMSHDVDSVHGVAFSTIWRPAGVVSGDMYDITQLDEDHVGFFITDAIGHDISAAMLAMMLSRTLAANRFDLKSGTFTEPKTMMALLNATLLQGKGERARFATAAYGILNCKTNHLVFAGGGHPPALVSNAECAPRLLESDGPLLGVFEDAQYEQRTMELTQNDTLLLYSDGFEQVLCTAKQSDSSLPVYLQCLNEFCRDSEEDVIHEITAHLDHSSVLKAEDDLTLICLHMQSQPTAMPLAA